MSVSIFEEIASSLTVMAICGPLGPDIPLDADEETLQEIYSNSDPKLDPLNDPCRVIASDGRTVGMLWYNDWFDDEWEEMPEPIPPISEVMQPLEPNDLLSSETTILDAVELFGAKDNPYFYVLHVNEVVGVVRYRDLFRPLGRLAFLALALEIEDQALRLCQSASLAEPCWLCLPENRKRIAVDVYEQRHRPNRNHNDRVPFRRLIACTHLVDKANMIWKQKLIAGHSRKEVLGFFEQLKKVRDLCAHPGNESQFLQQLPKERLAPFIESARRMRSSLNDSMQLHGVHSRASTLELSGFTLL